MTLHNDGASKIEMSLFNEQGEKLLMYYDIPREQFVMDRSESGETNFSENFPAITVAPASDTDKIHLRLFIDQSSVEAFGEDGEYVMTNRIFPSSPYNRMTFHADRGSFTIQSLHIYKLK